MEIDLNLLGDYATEFTNYLAKIDRRNQVAPKPKRANFEALHKKKNVKYLQGTGKSRADELKEHRKLRRSEMHMNYRKPNMKEVVNELDQLIHKDEINEISAVEMECPDVDNAHNNGSKVNGVECENRSAGAVKAKGFVGSKLNGVNNVKSGPRPAAPTSKPKPPTDSRKEQLAKWKREKEAASLVAKGNQKQPFKSGASSAPLPPGPAIPKTRSVALNQPKSVASGVGPRNVTERTVAPKPPLRPPQPMASTVNPVRAGTAKGAGAGKPAEVRRVTRAMSKAQSVQAPGATGKNAGQGMQPAIQKLKSLNISEKGGAGGAVSAGAARKPAVGAAAVKGPPSRPGAAKAIPKTAPQSRNPPSKRAEKQEPAFSSKKSDSSVSSSSSADSVATIISAGTSVESEQATQSAPSEQPQVSKKKAKPKAIDTVYVEYNSKFSNACVTLHAYAARWSQVIEDDTTIPEKVQGDIRSSLGKVKLLLESKLPQFGELLYSYLCQEAIPNPILACDLQGWWDVVSIQLDMVDDIFKDLEKLKEKNWIAEPAPVAIESKENTCPPRVPPPVRVQKAVKAKPSSGLRAFLAQQRKAQNPDSGNPEPKTTPPPHEVSAAVIVPNTSNHVVQEESKAETFDFGFFSISSPKPKSSNSERKSELRQSIQMTGPEVTPASAVPAGLRTPSSLSRRSSSSSVSSHRRLSQMILGVRKSMGSFSRIGVVSSPAASVSSMNTSGNSYTTADDQLSPNSNDSMNEEAMQTICLNDNTDEINDN